MEKQQRRKKYKRDDSANSVSITARDITIIKEVYFNRLMNSEQITALIGGNPKSISRRLYLLFHNGYLDRPKAQLLRFGNYPMVYAIGNKGAEILTNEIGIELNKIDWTYKNSCLEGVFLDHTLMITQFKTLIRLACKNRNDIEYISPEEIAKQRLINTRKMEDPLSWKGSMTFQQEKVDFTVIPDGGFGLFLKWKNKPAYYFFEADRSTMPVKRTGLNKSSFYKKILSYQQSWEQKLYSKYFNFNNPRILTITQSKERIENIIKINQEIDPQKVGYRMFLFITDDNINDLSNYDAIFGKIWLNGRRETVSMID